MMKIEHLFEFTWGHDENRAPVCGCGWGVGGGVPNLAQIFRLFRTFDSL
jgi:hypothetical protein